MTDVLWFNEINKKDISVVGGKGANLGELYNNKIPVPNGFVVTADAYKTFVEENNIQKKIISTLKKTDDSKKLTQMSEKISKIIIGATFSDELKKNIIKAYKKLNCFVAVRSSATAEDLPDASFAGQQATFLNIKGDKAVLDAVKRCFASLFTARAIAYRQEKGFDHSTVFIAVVVQEMVNSKTSGVVFCANPVTNNTDELVMEAVLGLGESLVGGELTPDMYIVKKKGFEITTRYLNSQSWGYFKDAKGKTVKKKLDKKETKQTLTDKEVLEIAKLAVKIEKHYKFPQDIEFAFDKKLYITQSRPITTLK